MSKFRDNVKKIYKNKRLLVIIGIVIVIASVALFMGNSYSRYFKKLKNYLEEIGYDCSGIYKYEDGYLDTEKQYTYCQMTTSNGIYKEMLISNPNRKQSVGVPTIQYKESVYGTYSFGISIDDYTNKYHKQLIIYNDELENRNFRFYPSGQHFYIGEQVNCNDESKKYKDICEDDKNDVNRAMREFESYFQNSGVKFDKCRW